MGFQEHWTNQFDPAMSLSVSTLTKSGLNRGISADVPSATLWLKSDL